VPTWSVVRHGGAALEAALRPGFDPAELAVIEGDPGIDPVAGAAPGTATYAEVRPEDVRISVNADGPSMVVVRNTWERGWEATVDGERAPVLRADSFLQAVPVPAGRHEVRLVYREPTIGWGLLASGMVWGVLGAALAVAVIRDRRRRRRAPPPAA
jgi:hypothetical protein